MTTGCTLLSGKLKKYLKIDRWLHIILKQSALWNWIMGPAASGHQKALHEGQILGWGLVDCMVVDGDLAVDLADLKIVKTEERHIDFR